MDNQQNLELFLIPDPCSLHSGLPLPSYTIFIFGPVSLQIIRTIARTWHFLNNIHTPPHQYMR